AAAQPESGACLAKAALKPRPVPAGASQVHVAIGPALVAVELPIHARECREIKNSATKAAQVGKRTRRRGRVEILHHVVTDDDVKRGRRLIAFDTGPLPSVALAEVFAGFDTSVGGSWQEAAQRRLHEASSASGIENSSDGQTGVQGIRGYQPCPGLHLAS